MAARGQRTRGELRADIAGVALSAAGGLLLLITKAGAYGGGWVGGSRELAYAVDATIGTAACIMIWFQRRWPTEVGLAIIVPMVLALSAGVASLVAAFNVARWRRPRAALMIAAVHQVAMAPYYLLWVRTYPFWAMWLLSLSENVAVVALGMYARARRQLLDSLRDRAVQAEAAQHLQAEQARHGERARIAREMHDVLGHRVSMMALQAGGLEVRPDLPPDQIRQTAALIRSTAHQALEELRGVIGVLTDRDDAGPQAPQPTLRDIGELVDDARRAGMEVELEMRVKQPETAPPGLGRDTYRIVREALTNASKHAPGAPTTVSVSGHAGEGLQVIIRNPLPADPPGQSALPGSGMGLAGLAERVALSGGILAHGPDKDRRFVVNAALQWQ